MNAHKKLVIGGLIIVGVIGYMAYLGASSSWQYYVSVDECLAERATFQSRRLRVSGKIVADSLSIDEGRRRAVFSLDGENDDLKVVCAGTLPDNLAEESEVVVEGRLDGSGVLQGDKLLTRCASKYDAEDATKTVPAETAARGRKGRTL